MISSHSVALQYIYDDMDFNRPFFITYVSNSLFVVLFPVQYLINWFKQRSGKQPSWKVVPRTLKQVH